MKIYIEDIFLNFTNLILFLTNTLSKMSFKIKKYTFYVFIFEAFEAIKILLNLIES